MGYTVTENGSEYDRGIAAGQIAERLREHDRRLEKINGSVDRMADKAEDQTTELQRLRSEVAALRGVLERNAADLTAAAERRERRADRQGTPLRRLAAWAAIILAAATIAGLAVTLATRH